MKSKKGLSYRIFGKKNIKMAERKTRLLGVNNKLNVVDLLAVRLLVSVVIFLSILYISKFGYVVAPIMAFLVYQSFIPLFIDSKIERRRKVLEKDALYFFEILTLSLEAGRSIKNAIEVTTSNIDSDLSSEFKKVIKDVNYGKDLDEALDDLKMRIPSDTINNIILNIRQANMFGNNIIDAVYSQIAYIREKRLFETKAYISKIPVKISVVSVIFFIPLLLLLLLGPMLIDLL